MKPTPKVLWGEGLFLKPQHFQRQDLYHEGRLAEMSRAAHPYLWGIRSLKVDKDALATGILRISELQVVFPDGELYSAPDGDDLPETVNLASLGMTADALTYHIALAHMRDYGSNFHAEGGENGLALRYYQSNEAAPDLFTNAVESEISVLKKRVRLMADNEPKERLASLPLLRIRRTATGGYELDPLFMPPAMSIEALPILYTILRRMLDILQAKCNALYGHHREASKTIIEFRSGDVASFWFLHTASAAFAQLSHYFHHPRLHPERLFHQMLGLAGQLLTFSKTYMLTDLPIYDHAEPAASFLKLDRIIRDLLETVISTRYVAINLTETKPSFHIGRIESDKLAQGAAFYLAISADMPAVELVEAVPLRVKIGAPDDVEKLVLSAMPGIRLAAAPQVPAAIPVRTGSYYFTVEPHGPLYERMLQAKSIMIYVPSGFKDLKLELVAVIE